MAEHTPGPWFIGDEDEQPEGFCYQEVHSGAYGSSDFKSIAYAQAHFDGERAGEMTPQDYANARLIAAAPDLYEAVRKAAARFREYETLHAAKGSLEGDAKARANAEFAARMEAALAKAEAA